MVLSSPRPSSRLDRLRRALASLSALSLSGLALTGCLAAQRPSAPPPRPPAPAPLAAPPAAPPAPAPAPDSDPPPPPEPGADSDPPPPAATGEITDESSALSLAAGRSIVDVHVPAESFVSIGVFGPQGALLGFDVLSVSRAEDAAPLDGELAPLRAHRPLDEDGLLPRIVSFRSPAETAIVRILVDAAEAVEVRRSAAPVAAVELIPTHGKGFRYKPVQSPSIGFPAPASRDEGYFLQSPARYQFARTDVIAALLRAFQKTRTRFKRDPIAIADISQWDGIRPATDLGRPRHISHEGGRDVDVALAANDEEPSTVRAHCTGVLVEQTVQGCGPGTARGFDASRMAYFLGVLFESVPPVEKIFVDDVYLRELRRAAERLHERRLLKDRGFEGLSDDAIVRPSPWHTDHLHVRFAGPAGRPAF
jgi:hypothetical protein